jgi:DNA invertase Pin-like site-specific DNA recombinase
MSRPTRVALYARVSTSNGQTTETQLHELREQASIRGWTVYREYVDEGISGSGRVKRPALDALIADARRGRFDVVCVWALDRIGRNLKHLVSLLEDFESVGVKFLSLKEGLDLGSAAGRLQLHILAALSEFERSRVQELVRAGISRARAQGRRCGRPEVIAPEERLAPVRGLSVREAARRLGVSHATAHRWLSRKVPPEHLA